MDTVIVMNLLFDLAILLLSIFVYKEKKSILVVWIGVAFFFFAASYVLTIFGFGSSLILIPLRAVGYLSIIAGLILQMKH